MMNNTSDAVNILSANGADDIVELHSSSTSKMPAENENFNEQFTSGTAANANFVVDMEESDNLGELCMDAQSPSGAISASSSMAFGKRGSLTKRVSFGSTKGTVVETFVYDSPGSALPENDSSTRPIRPLEPPSKVRVTASDSQVPSYIAPPTAVANSDSADNLAGRTVPPGSTGVVQFSPPLPSLKKMEEEKDNPFRPDGELNAEVNPIVEVYKKRPFPEGGPDSPDGSRPISPTSPTPTPGAAPAEESPKKNSKWKFKKGGGKENGIAADGEAPIKPSQISLQLEATPGGVSEQQTLIGEAQKTHVTSPKAGKVELVHLEEKKRKCGCCTIQ